MLFPVSTFFPFYFHFFSTEIGLSIPFRKFTKAPIKRYSAKYICFIDLINFRKLCSLSATFVNTQETFQRSLNVVVRVIWHRDVGKWQINFKTALCISMLKFTTLNNVKSTLSISTLMLTTLENVETMLLFSTSCFITLINAQTTLWIRPFSKSWKEQIIFLSFKKKILIWLITLHLIVKINVRKYNAWCVKGLWK